MTAGEDEDRVVGGGGFAEVRDGQNITPVIRPAPSHKP